MLLLIDNYDSFTYNLAQGFGSLKAKFEVVRNDAISIKQIRDMAPAAIVISPGPGRPKDAGISMDAIREFAGEIDILGICLGHQCIGEVYGARIVHARHLMHGKTSTVFHSGLSVFAGQPNPFVAARYHSLVVSPSRLPGCLRVTATTEDGAIMGLRHREHRVVGVQVHPESFMTHGGQRILSNFLEGQI